MCGVSRRNCCGQNSSGKLNSYFVRTILRIQNLSPLGHLIEDDIDMKFNQDMHVCTLGLDQPRTYMVSLRL